MAQPFMKRIAPGTVPVKRTVLSSVGHWTLVGVSMWMSVDFFHRLGTGAGSVILGGLAVGFELSKREAWRSFVWTKKPAALILAVGLTVLSVLAAASYVVDQMEGARALGNAQGEPRDRLQKEIKDLDDELARVSVLQAGLKPEYRTSVLQYSQRMEDLRAQRRIFQEQLEKLPPPGVQAGGTLSGRFGAFSGIEDFPLWFWLGVIGLLEFGIVGTIPSPSLKNQGGQWEKIQAAFRWDRGGTQVGQVVGQVVPGWDSTGTEVGQVWDGERPTVGQVLEAAFSGPGEPLRGRREVAVRLRVGERDVRKVMDRLQALHLASLLPGKGLVLQVDLQDAVERLEEENVRK